MNQIHLTEVITMPQTTTSPRESSAPSPWQIDRCFEGNRTAQQVVSDLIKVHAEA